MLEFECPHCQEVLSIPEQFIGTTGTCRKCGKEITIEAQATHDATETTRPPALVAFHCEATGPSTRKCNITELAGVKFDLNGQELDSFSSFANPGHMIPPRISEKTGVTDEMVQGAPPASEVIKQWFEWVGPHGLLFSHHAHFDARFVCAAYLKEDLDPPALHVMDVLSWARHLDVPVEEFKLRSLLDFIGYRVKRAHRALDTCQGVSALVANLTIRQVGSHHVASQSGVLGKLLGKTSREANSAEAYKTLLRLSRTLEVMCGEGFYTKVRDDPRRKRMQNQGPAAGGPMAAGTSADNQRNSHRQEWFDERRGILERAAHQRAQSGVMVIAEGPQDAPWEYLLLEASQSESPDEQKRLCLEAVSMGAQDPWPYNRLTNLFIKEKNYQAALETCVDYFKADSWKMPQWADSGLKLLRRMEKLEKKLQTDA